MGKRSIGNLAVASYDDIFASTSTDKANNKEQVIEIPLEELHPPEFHPFQVNDDLSMQRLVRSIKRSGFHEPGLARPRKDGGYELLCGNRRKRACELGKIPTMPIIIREMDDVRAAYAMVDSNLEKRKKILFSEKAWAYRVKMDALNHSGVKGDMLSVDILAEQTGEKKSQIYRIIRLTELVPDLLDKVDTKQLAFNPGVELSYLTRTEQAAVVDAMAKHDVKPSLSQTVRLKKLSQAGNLTIIMIDVILSESKEKAKTDEGAGQFSHFFPAEYTVKQMNEVIAGLLRNWRAAQVKTQ